MRVVSDLPCVGGAATGFDLAAFVARFFARGTPVAAVGLDEAVFLQSVAVGDLVTFKARVVHATPRAYHRFISFVGRPVVVWPALQWLIRAY
eukprot:COSAG01_NODE_2313_length_7933_cov_79.874777_4_plen_92_part_00